MKNKIVGWFIKIYYKGEIAYLDDKEGAYPGSIRARACFISKQEAITHISRFLRNIDDYQVFYGVEPYYYDDYRKDWGIPG